VTVVNTAKTWENCVRSILCLYPENWKPQTQIWLFIPGWSVLNGLDTFLMPTVTSTPSPITVGYETLNMGYGIRPGLYNNKTGEVVFSWFAEGRFVTPEYTLWVSKTQCDLVLEIQNMCVYFLIFSFVT
jgi:hypothetical protein